MKGIVKFFNDVKAFGFITCEDGKDVFVHQSNLDENVELYEGDKVEFEIENSDRGPKAVKVKKE